MMSVSCERVQDLLPERLAGELDAAQRAAVAAHLAGCPDCRAADDVIRRVRQAHASPPAHLAERVVRAAAAQTAPSNRRHFAGPRQLALAATLMAAVIGGALLLDFGRGGSPGAAPHGSGVPAASARSAAAERSGTLPTTDGPAFPALEDPVVHGSLLGQLTETELQALLDKLES